MLALIGGKILGVRGNRFDDRSNGSLKHRSLQEEMVKDAGQDLCLLYPGAPRAGVLYHQLITGYPSGASGRWTRT